MERLALLASRCALRVGRSFVLSVLLSLAAVLAPSMSVAAAGSSADFSDDYDQVFQIRVVSSLAGGKSSIGSGFQVTADGRLVTNYHVVADFVDDPDRHRITYVTGEGNTGELQLLDFDVVDDLAVLKHPAPAPDHFALARRAPDKGETVHALGNPGDWGVIMVPGPANGLVEHRHEQRLLFSGSLNPGMSGGPSLDANGEVIGVNVATAGSQLSFLVPVAGAQALLERNRALAHPDYDDEITTQIKRWQRARLAPLIDMPWPREEFNGRDVFGEIRKDFQCWGASNEDEDERAVTRIARACRTGDDVFITGDLELGHIRYSFLDATPERLNPFQFANAQAGVHMSEDNPSAFRHSTEYRCESDFVQPPQPSVRRYDRLVTCIRAYKRMPGLYDSLHTVLSVTEGRVRRAYLSVSAAEPDQIRALNRRFAEAAL